MGGLFHPATSRACVTMPGRRFTSTIRRRNRTPCRAHGRESLWFFLKAFRNPKTQRLDGQFAEI